MEINRELMQVEDTLTRLNHEWESASSNLVESPTLSSA